MAEERKPEARASRKGTSGPQRKSAGARPKPGVAKGPARKGPADGSDGDGRSLASSLDPQVLRMVAAALAGLVVGLVLGALLLGADDGGDEPEILAASSTGARIVSPAELAREATALGRPIYWAGPAAGDSLELERSRDGNVTVRYIPEDAGDDPEDADLLTIVTYRYLNARRALQRQAAQGGVLSRKLPNDGFVISNTDQPTNAYVAYGSEDYQVEIYDPRPGRALELALNGSVVPAG